MFHFLTLPPSYLLHLFVHYLAAFSSFLSNCHLPPLPSYVISISLISFVLFFPLFLIHFLFVTSLTFLPITIVSFLSFPLIIYLFSPCLPFSLFFPNLPFTTSVIPYIFFFSFELPHLFLPHPLFFTLLLPPSLPPQSSCTVLYFTRKPSFVPLGTFSSPYYILVFY